MPTAYHYNYENFTYSGKSEVHVISGYDHPILPAFSTLVEVPDFDEDTELAIFDVDTQHWNVKLKNDEVIAYHKETMHPKNFEDASLVTDDYTLLAPISDKCTWNGSEWEEDVEKWRAFKKDIIRAECGSKIDAGFTANVLFPDCNYRNDRDQQNNIRDCALGDGGHIWMNENFSMHTKDQAEQIYSISRSEVQAHKLKYANKCTYLNDQARTVEEIKAVTWDSAE